MNRRDFLKRTSLLAAGASLLPGAFSAYAQGENAKKPNILVIVADDLTPNFLGCYGGPTPTPHIDALAKQGVRFTNAHAVTPLCNPSRYTLLTGQFPGRNPNTFSKMPENEQYWLGQSTKWTPEDPSIARMMKSAGYYTGYVGKWHSNFELEGGVGLKSDKPLDADDPAVSKQLAELHAKHVKSVKEIGGFDFVQSLQVGNLGGKKATLPQASYHNPEWQTQGALDFLDSAAEKDAPFFLHLANSIPHDPDNLKSLEQDNRYTLAGKLDKPITCHPPRESVKKRLAEAGLNTSGPLGSINGGTIVLDDQVGVVMKRLEETGQLDNTMIIWLADHSIYGKGTAFTPGTHVPLIISWPGVLPEDQTVETPVSLIDLFKTCATAAGATLPEDAIDGENLMPLMTGKTTEHAPLYQEVNWHRGVIKGRYHYVAFRPSEPILKKMENGEIPYAADQGWRNNRNVFGDLNLPFKPGYLDADQLYDLKVDPFERVNLADDPAYAEIVKDLKAELAKYTSTFERPFPIETPPFMKTKAYADLKAKRKLVADEKFTHYPEPYDAERIYNLNLLDPLAE